MAPSDELSPLTIDQVISSLPGYSFSSAAKRNRGRLLDEARRLPDPLKQRLAEAVEARKLVLEQQKSETLGKKRKRAAESRPARRVAQRTEAGNDARRTANAGIAQASDGVFLSLPTEEERRACMAAFVEATSNAGLKQEVCVICARELWARDGKDVPINNIPNRRRLIPKRTHAKHQKFGEGLLLVLEKIRGEGENAKGWCCYQCLDALSEDKLPRYSLANGMWIGDIPEELQGLTIPEQMLIALQYPRCFIFKLYTKDRPKSVQDPDELRTALRGNVTTFQLNTDDIAKMVQGDLHVLPRPTSLLASVISVAFIGTTHLPKKWLKSAFRVRRWKVYRALRWLVAHNPLYANVKIDEDRVAALPVEDIPNEILATMHVHPDDDEATRERESYVPGDVDNDDDDGSCAGEGEPTQGELRLRSMLRSVAYLKLERA